MMKNVSAIEADTSNFRAFIAPGNVHCILPYDGFYSVQADGENLVDWVSDLANGNPVSTWKCKGCTK